MKIQHAIALFGWLSAVATVQAQDTTRPTRNPLASQTQVEVFVGLATPLLQSGSELKRAMSLRDAGLSYYQRPDGVRQKTGAYSTPIGWSAGIAFYKPLRGVNGLMLGVSSRFGLTGSQPTDGGYEEGYFFNYVSVGPALKYYPSSSGKFFVKADVGMGSVFTKNRYLDNAGQQNFFHQFGIGYSAGLGVGYSVTPFANRQKSLDIQAGYQQFGTRVEVNGLGDDSWQFGSLSAGVAFNF